MSNKTPENKYEVGAGSGQSDEVKNSNSSDFFELCTAFDVDQFSSDRLVRYPVDYKTGRFVLACVEYWHTRLILTINPPVHLHPIVLSASTISSSQWGGYVGPGFSQVSFNFNYGERHIGKHTLFFSSPNASSSLDVFIAPEDLTQSAMYKLNGEDQGQHDLLLYYNEFYTLEFHNQEIDGFEFLESSKIESISYDKDAPYSIDFIEDEELVENQSGESSIEGLSSAKNKTAKMTGGVKGLRVRYKNPDNPYFGPLDVTLHFQEGMVLKPPMEVVKRVDA